VLSGCAQQLRVDSADVAGVGVQSAPGRLCGSFRRPDVGSSIRVRRCAPGSDRWARVPGQSSSTVIAGSLDAVLNARRYRFSRVPPSGPGGNLGGREIAC
jgi:hypothetical protein